MVPNNLLPTQPAPSSMPSSTPLSPGGKSSGTCIAALVLGICAVIIPILGIVLGILAIIFGVKGLNRVKVTGEQGKGMAIAGIVLGAVGIVLMLFLLLLVAPLLYFGVLSPSNMLPERTMFKAPFIATESAIVTTDGVVRIPFVNGQGSTVTITGGADETAMVGGSVDNDCAGATLRSVTLEGGSPLALPVQITNGQNFVLEFQCSPKERAEDFKATLGFKYATSSGIERTHTGEVMARVQ